MGKPAHTRKQLETEVATGAVPLRLVPIAELMEWMVVDGNWLIFHALGRGAAQWSIPELGTRQIKAGEWCLICDYGAQSQLSHDAEAQGVAMLLPVQILAGLSRCGHRLPAKLTCLICPQRDAAFFVKGINCGRIGRLVESMTGFSPRDLAGCWLRHSQAWELLALAANRPELHGAPPCQSCRPCELAIIESVAEYLEANLAEDHSLAALARRHFINECKLKKGFREHYGTTVFGYLRRRRMEQARILLGGGEASVLAVANAVGYANPSHFARAFREVHGINPRAATRLVQATG